MGAVRKAVSPAGAPPLARGLISPKAARTLSMEAVPRTYQRELRMSELTTRSRDPGPQTAHRAVFRSLAMSMTSATTAEAVGSLPAPRP